MSVSKRLRKNVQTKQINAFKDWMQYTLVICTKRCDGNQEAGVDLFNCVMESLGVPGFEGALKEHSQEAEPDAV